MRTWQYLILLLPLLPLVAAFWNRMAALVVSGGACAALLGIFLNLDPSAFRHLLLAQGPLVLLLSGLSVYVSSKDMLVKKEEHEKEQGSFEELKKKHSQFKEAVAKGEKEENQALQIYSLSKGLAEAVSWGDMTPRLTLGIQKIFGAYEFILYALREDGSWELLHRRGSWAQDPPVTGPISGEGCILLPNQTQEVVPVQVVPIYINRSAQPAVNGVLFLKSVTEKVAESDLLRVGREFGEQIGMAIDKALLFAQIEMQSRTDGLTGILRRQSFMDRLDEEMKRAKAFNTPFCLLMVDIDHFKQVNDTHGHAAGDAVLARMGQILKESFYETDIVGRYGGEEFIVLLPHAQMDGVVRKAENLRQRLEKERIPCGFVDLSVTVSIGVASFPQHGQTAEALIASSDRALYQAKESGRNRVVVA
ncbi:MAG: GGDEF domain-containing protein [Elusimicrobia bacterium]|nr:GGDEF domain-containing protein [Candidatus Obscuribacterium magneticum]